jgi:hypothetical protein
MRRHDHTSRILTIEYTDQCITNIPAIDQAMPQPLRAAANASTTAIHLCVKYRRAHLAMTKQLLREKWVEVQFTFTGLSCPTRQAHFRGFCGRRIQ